MKPPSIRCIGSHGHTLTAAALISIASFCAHGDTLIPTYDAVGRFSLGTLDRTSTGNLYVGPIATNDFARTFLTFDLSGQTAATGAITLAFSVAGTSGLSENNTYSSPQSFTLYSLASDWNGTAAPGPATGTVLATVSFTPSLNDDTQSLSFSSAALTTAFNNALGGNLHLAIKSDVEGANVRSFKWMASREDTGFEPRLTYTPDTSLAIKSISADDSSNVQLILSGASGAPYRVYRSTGLETPYYRKRWSERFVGSFPGGNSEVSISEPKGTDARGFFVATSTQPKARIMCVGDSITEGGTGYFIYRPVLNNLLAAAGYRFEFVGSQINTQGGLTLKHEGYAGQRADTIAGYLATSFPNHIADIVLIHSGHNNDATVDTESVILNRVETATRSMISTCRTHNPDVIILLAQVITSSKLPKYSYIPALNLRLAEVATDLHSATQPVWIVNQADGWDPVADTVTDQVHPTEAGATKMANKWLTALQPLLE